MREAFVAIWKSNKWWPQTNGPPEYRFVDAPWPENPRYQLPTPRFNVGATIRFRWLDGYITGTIIEARAYFDISPNRVTYTIRRLGDHRREFIDDGTYDAELI
jgi:hypothetical protein